MGCPGVSLSDLAKYLKKNMSEELTLLQKLMTSKPPTRWITRPPPASPASTTSKPPTRWITGVHTEATMLNNF